MIHFPHKKREWRCITRSIRKLSDFIHEKESLDIMLVGRRFTWSSNHNRLAMSRIDRFLISKEWEDHFAKVG